MTCEIIGKSNFSVHNTVLLENRFSFTYCLWLLLHRTELSSDDGEPKAPKA